MSDITIALDAGHGGSDPGAVYNGRAEKDDALRLTRAVGEILEMNGINVFYVRDDDEYETPFKKATDANNSGADYFISIHRNSSERNNQYSGIESLVYKDSGIRHTLAFNINKELADAGFENLGITERPNLVVLKRTQMPAVLVEVGFINSDTDNKIFDDNFNEIAKAIADGILETVYSQTSKTDISDSNDTDDFDGMMRDDTNNYDNMPRRNTDGYDNTMRDNTNNYDNMPRRNTDGYDNMMRDNSNNYGNMPSCRCDEDGVKLYRIQTGAYRNKENADRMLDSLLIEGFPAFIVFDKGYYKVQVGAFIYLSNAIKMEQRLRRFRYNTYIVYD